MTHLKCAYYSDLIFPSNAVATNQVAKTVDALQRFGLEAHLFIPIPWKYTRIKASCRLENLQQYYGLSSNFKVVELFSPLPLIKKIHRFPLTHLALNIIKDRGYDFLCVRNYWHLKMGLARHMTVLYETYKYRAEEERSRRIIHLLNEKPNFMGVIMHSKLARDYWVSMGANPEKIVTIHNGIERFEIPASLDRAQARQALKIPEDSRVISYVGNIGKSKGMESILEMARYLPEFTFFLVGGKYKKDITRLKKLANKLEIKNIEIFEWVPPAEVYPFLLAADCVIIPPTGKPLLEAGNTVLPLKTYMYIASGVPILAPDIKDTAEILQHGKTAFLLKPDSPQENSEAIRAFFSDRASMERIALNARELSRVFTWEKRAEKIVDFASSMLKTGD